MVVEAVGVAVLAATGEAVHAVVAERLAVAVYAVGAQCHVAGHIIVRWYIFYVRGINIFQELSQSH